MSRKTSRHLIKLKNSKHKSPPVPVPRVETANRLIEYHVGRKYYQRRLQLLLALSLFLAMVVTCLSVLFWMDVKGRDDAGRSQHAESVCTGDGGTDSVELYKDVKSPFSDLSGKA